MVQQRQARAAKVEGIQRLVAPGVCGVHHQHAPVADDLDLVAAHHHGGVFLDAYAQRFVLLLHQSQQAPDAAALDEVLVDDHVVPHETEAAADVLALAQGALHQCQHVLAWRDEDSLAHHRRARAFASHHTAAGNEAHHRVQQRAVHAARAQGVDQARLLAATEEDRLRGVDQGHPGRVAHGLGQVLAGNARADAHMLTHGTAAPQAADDGLRGGVGVTGRGGEDGELRALAACQFNEPAPDGVVVVAHRAAHRNHGALGGRAGGGEGERAGADQAFDAGAKGVHAGFRCTWDADLVTFKATRHPRQLGFCDTELSVRDRGSNAL